MAISFFVPGANMAISMTSPCEIKKNGSGRSIGNTHVIILQKWKNMWNCMYPGDHYRKLVKVCRQI
jgi:hypothetical protein